MVDPDHPRLGQGIRRKTMSNEYFVVAETKNGSAFPKWASYFRPGQYAAAVREQNSRSDGALDIETDEQAAEFESERSAVRVQFITRADAAEWFDSEYPDSPVMKAMRALDWVVEIDNDETGETTYQLAE
jgi:hypothetical protein